MATKSFHKIVFAVDTSRQSRAAAPTAARIALQMGGEVIVLHVCTTAPERGPWTPAVPPAIRRVLDETVSRMQLAGVAATSDVRRAPADQIADEIVAAADDHSADLILLGSRGLSDFRGLFLGSVSHRVIEKSDRPVLVVPRSGRRPEGAIQRILLALAGGEDVPDSVAAAIAIARRTHAQVLVLHVRYIWPSGEVAAYTDDEAAAANIVGGAVEDLTAAGVTAKGRAPLGIGVAREIADEARAWNADLIVMGSRRLSDLGSLLLGGTGHEVMRLSDRPVLITRRPAQTASSRGS